MPVVCDLENDCRFSSLLSDWACVCESIPTINICLPLLSFFLPSLPRMTILPPADKLKILLNKVKEFHQKFTQQYS